MDHDAEVRATARLLAIEDLLERLPAQMSGGERQRVAMGRAISRRPSVFLGTPRINLLEGVVHAPLCAPMTLDLGRQRLRLPEPLTTDHQLLRIQQGRPVIVGLRPEAVRIAPPSQVLPG